tara:strand:+ start:1678 stop:2655 length:978 start_codon:yes stop_codon:yes gene_type:complete
MPEPIKKVGKALWNVSLYTLSIPERYMRGLTALTGGMLKETTDLVVPDFVQDTTSYNIFVGNLLRFAVENVGGVEGLYEDDSLEGEYATRKVIGNAIEGVGIATVHASPLWIFAFFADSVKGGQAYLDRLSDELVERGYIESDKTSKSLKGLLEGIEKTTSSFAQNIDTPPLSKDEIIDNISEIRDSINELWVTTGKAAGDITEDVGDIMQEFIDTANEEDQSFLELGGLMTLQATSRAKKAVGMAITAPHVAGKMLSDNILGYYRDTLADIHEHGYAQVASEVIDPYGNAILKQFDANKETWTEKIFKGSVSGLQSIFGMQTSK